MTSPNDPDLLNLDEKHVISYTKIPEFQKGGITETPTLVHDDHSFLNLNIPQVDGLIETSLQKLTRLMEERKKWKLTSNR